MSTYHKYTGHIIYLGLVLLFGLFFDQLGFKFLAIVTLVLALGLIAFLPNKFSIYVLLTFISFQGFLKVVSNYHPVIHLGGDFVVIGLFAKFIIQQYFNWGKQKSGLPPLSLLFIVHFGWVFICYFNPYSLGVIPSIAGSKIYVSMFILFFFGYYLTENLKDVHRLFWFFIALTAIHTAFSIYQGMYGPTTVTSLHPRYIVQLEKYKNVAFRPFGLTNLPGGPSVYTYYILPFIIYFLFFGKSLLQKLFCLTLIPSIGLSLLLCQVRSAIAKGIFAVAIFIMSFITSKYPLTPSRRVSSLLTVVCLGGLIVTFFPLLMSYSVGGNQDNERAFERSLTTFNVEAMSNARRGTWDRFIQYANEVPLGAGFARIGAAAGAFKNFEKKDRIFAQDHFFSDNLFITLLVELGIPGLIFVSLLIGVILWYGLWAWRNERRTKLIGPQLAIFAALFAIFIGSYGAEGIIYNPESCFFWFFSGVLIKTMDSKFNISETTPKIS